MLELMPFPTPTDQEVTELDASVLQMNSLESEIEELLSAPDFRG